MEAIRHIVTPETNHLEIKLPENFVHEQLEVIILPISKPQASKKAYKSLMGSISEAEGKKMLQYLENTRNEW